MRATNRTENVVGCGTGTSHSLPYVRNEAVKTLGGPNVSLHNIAVTIQILYTTGDGLITKIVQDGHGYVRGLYMTVLGKLGGLTI